MTIFGGLESELSLNKRDFTRGLKKAGASVTTFGSLASGEFDEVGDEAEGAAAKTTLFSYSLSGLADEAKDAIIPTALLQSRIDELGDEETETSLRTGMLSSAFGSLSLSSSGASMSVGFLSSSLIGLTAVIGGALAVAAPLAVTLGAVAAGAGALGLAFGTIIGSGIVAWGKGFQKAIKRVGKQIKVLVADFGQQFVPLLKDAVNALPGLVKNILKAIGPLDAFKKELRRLGGIALKVIPQLVGGIFDLARTALPIFRKFIGFLSKNGTPTFNLLQKVVARTWPHFKQLIGAVGSVLPPFLRFGTTLAEIVVPALSALIAGLGPVFKTLNKVAVAVRDAIPGFVRLGKKVGTKTVNEFRKLKTFTTGTLLPSLKASFNQILKNARSNLNPLGKELKKTKVAFRNQFVLPARNAKTEFSKNLGQIKTEGKQTFATLRSIISRVSKVFQQNFGRRVRKMSALWSQHMTGPDGILTNARTAFNALWSNIIKPILDLIQAGWKLFGDDLIRILRGTLGTLATIAEQLMDTILTAINIGLDLISGDWEGAWDSLAGYVERTIGRIDDWLRGSAKQMLSGAAGVIVKAFKSAWNAAMPDKLGIPKITVGGGKFMGKKIPSLTIGGQSINLPHLDTGGYVQSSGLAMIHAGEQVVPAAQVDKGAGGGGNQPMVIQLDGEQTTKLMQGEAVKVVQQREDELKRSRRRAESGGR